MRKHFGLTATSFGQMAEPAPHRLRDLGWPPESPSPALLEQGKIDEDPILDHLAAISVGVYNENCLLDLDYPEDRDATVDANVVMTGSGQYVEVQSSGEESTFRALR